MLTPTVPVLVLVLVLVSMLMITASPLAPTVAPTVLFSSPLSLSSTELSGWKSSPIGDQWLKMFRSSVPARDDRSPSADVPGLSTVASPAFDADTLLLPAAVMWWRDPPASAKKCLQEVSATPEMSPMDWLQPEKFIVLPEQKYIFVAVLIIETTATESMHSRVQYRLVT